MATAYTPGLKVSRSTLIRKIRRLPLKGEVLAEVGQKVTPEDILARAELPGIMRTVRAAELLGVEPKDLPATLQVKEGDSVQKGDVLAKSASFFGLFKSECKAPIAGQVEMINLISGNIGIREAPSPIEVTAYIHGQVAEVLPSEGAVVETTGALLQGIFGVGGEKNGTIRFITGSRENTVTANDIPQDAAGCILIGGAGADLGALNTAAERGAVGLVVGGIVDEDLVKYLGNDIGVAITGTETVQTTVMLTEGFGEMPMAGRAWDLLKSLEGKKASINGATQIRAGVIRPEVIVAASDGAEGNGTEAAARESGALEAGSPIRLIREPHFGMLGTVVELPPELQQVPSGAKVRVLVAELSDGQRVTVPRANVELIEQ